METMQLVPIRTNVSSVNQQIIVPNTPQIIDITPLSERPLGKSDARHFIEANTKEVDIFQLKNECVVPVFSKDNEITISHPNFIETVWEAANKFFPNERFLEPDIRVSHVIKGRVPEAIHKPVNQLLETDKTIYYERMAFCFEIPSIYEDIEGNRLNLTIGGVRAYNHENLYSKKGVEKFKVFIGFKNLVCCNLCVSTDGYQTEIKVMSIHDLFNAVMMLFQRYNVSQHLHLMRSFKDTYLTEHQFAQLIGKSKLYHCLPNAEKKTLPAFEFGDAHINAVARAYYNDDNFKIDEGATAINLWRVYNLFTSANKSSYIDNLLDRSLNATELTTGINKALHGDSEYKWFIE
ncbi:DUF3871 family protein [Dysgonomonas sp. 520]|uniref:DUF3871 family protein n=1 Tax=Dysgonomonas sp. 520 TaxID=2302931 RepID=UPI0013D36C8B|nr:DUF3871 family protein [Dysgonomonas sp. 520]NDW11138.1 DUF3871 family protein [Dysgonomonas sp. 520]